MAGLLSTIQKKPGLLASMPVDYRGTLGELPSTFPSAFTTKTSTQAVPDETTGPNIPKVVAQGFAQGFGVFGAELAAVPGRIVDVARGKMPTVPFGETTFTPTGALQQSIFGTDKPISFRTQGQLPGVPETGPIAPIIGAFFGGLDLTGAGQGLRGLKGLTGALKSAKTAEDAARLMKGAGFVDDVIKDYAPMFAKITDAKKIEEGLLAAEKLQNTTKVSDLQKAKDAILESPTLSKSEIETVKSAKSFDDVWDIVKTKGPDTQGMFTTRLQTAFKSPAQKAVAEGKTVEEFVKAQGTPVFRGGDTAIDTARGGGKGISVSTKETAGLFTPPKGGIVDEAVLPHTAKVLKEADIPKNLQDAYIKEAEVLADPNNFSSALQKSVIEKQQAIIDYARKNGFDAVEFLFEKEIRVIKPNILKTKSQLTKSFEEAKGASATPTRSSSAQVAPGAVADRPSARTIPEQTTPVLKGESPTIQSSPALEEVKHVPEDVGKPFQQVVDIGEKGAKNVQEYRDTTGKIAKAFRSFVEYVQDTDTRIKKLLERKEMKVDDVSNQYQKATLYPGRVDAQIKSAHKEFEDLVNDTVYVAGRSGSDVALIRQDVNEYLQAVHAPERNAVLGDGAAGMTNAEAKAVLTRITDPEIIRIATAVRELNNKGLVLLKDAGVISDELFTTLTTKYKNHVPLNRIFDTDEIQGALSVRGFDVRSSGIKRAKGSEREVADIWANIQFNYEQAVLRSEKNIVDQATLAFARENRESLKGLMEIRKPRAVGKDFDGRIMMERTNDPSYLQLYENGKPVWIHITDPALAVAFRGVGREKLPTVMHAVGSFTRFYAGLATRFNPEFAFPNKIRDLQEMMVYMAAQKDVGFKGATKLVAKDPASAKAVWDAIRGVDSPGARVYNEMKMMGGTTGGMGLSTRKQVELNLDKMFETAGSKPRQAAVDTIQLIDDWNTVFEDSTRLSVYKQALSQGLSKERAAFLAKEASINFNRMGRGGPVINALWMFSNASIQGSAKMIRSLKNPKVAAGVVAIVGSSVAVTNQWNDRVDPDWRDKVTKWDRMNGLPVVLPGGKDGDFNYFVIPVSWGIKPVKVMADYAYDASSGRETDMGRMASDLFTSVADAYNPIGGTDWVSALSPSVLDVPFEIARNKAWSGSKIRPDFDKNAPKDVQYFSTLGETALGEAFIQTTKELQSSTGIALSPANMKYAFEQYIGGAGKFGFKTANTIIGAATGEGVPADEYPFVSRFYRTRTQEEVGMGAGGDTSVLKSVLENQSRERFYAREAAEDTYTRMKEMPVEEASAQFRVLVKEDPDLAKKVSDIAKQEKKGLNYTERLITQLGVTNGERALYIKTKFDELKSQEDKKNLWQSYVEKGIITEQVADQVLYLLKSGDKTPKATP